MHIRFIYFLKKAFSKQLLICFSLIASVSITQAQAPSDKILELLNFIQHAYVDTVNMEHLTEVAVISMLAEMDPHSVYIPQKEVKEMNESLKGSFEGIGIQFDIFRDTVFVVAAIPGGPAGKLGVESGDRLIRADGKLISGTGMSDEKVIEKLRGIKGSQVQLEFKRSGNQEFLNFTITRDQIPIESVDAAFMLNDATGYIKINRFSKNTLDEFKESLKKMQHTGLQNLVLDLRGNGGGYLFSAVEVTDELLDSKEVIVSTRGNKQSDQVFKAKPKGLFTEGKLIVLIDEGTASASEILAGAIQDWDRGIILGRRSFGKGLVMKPFSFSDGSMVRLTTSRYYTPSGRCIQKDYSESKESYDDEIYHRFEHGEFYSLDSINIPTELKFQTSNGRTVYGGGGILPDIFFAADTMLLGKRYQDILKSDKIIEYTLTYLDKNRHHLTETYETEMQMVQDNELRRVLTLEFSNFLIEQGSSEHEIDADLQENLSIQLTAFLAKYLWGEESYYKVISYKQDILDYSLELMSEDINHWDSLSERSK